MWSEHLCEYFDEMSQPSSLECVRKIRRLSDENWIFFAEDTVEVADMPHGHLASYSYQYDETTGEVLDTSDKFPDFDAIITGTSSAIPNMLTG